MRIIAKRTLKDFWDSHNDAEQPLLDWYEHVALQEWNSPNEVKETYGNASVIASNRVVFNIKGNDYRLVVHIDYRHKILFVIWVGSHSDYDKIDAKNVAFKKKD